MPVVSLDSLKEKEGVKPFAFLDQTHPVQDLTANLLDDELIDQTRDFVYELPDHLRDVVRRHYWLEQSQTEIAEDLGITRSAVSHALARVNKLGRAYFGVLEH